MYRKKKGIEKFDHVAALTPPVHEAIEVAYAIHTVVCVAKMCKEETIFFASDASMLSITELGVASVAGIYRPVKVGGGIRMDSLELRDYVGLNVALHVTGDLYRL